MLKDYQIYVILSKILSLYMMVNLTENLAGFFFETKHIWLFHTYVYNVFVEIHLET
jgi:hypothetical protein